MRHSAPLALVLSLAVAACRDGPSPVAPPPATAPAPLYSAGASAVPGRYIVVFRGDRTIPPGLADRLVADYGGRVDLRYSRALVGFAGELPAPAVEAIRRHPLVEYVEEDAEMTVVGSQPGATWGLDRIDDRAGLDGLYEWTTSGAGVTAYVIDTGLHTGHADFGGRASVGYDALGGSGQDCNGHGTHVAGTIGGDRWGVAKDVALVGVRVLGCGGLGFVSWIVGGIDWVTANHRKPAVANMSLGGGASSALDQAVRGSIAAGVSYALAAGNGGADACATSPARVVEAMTVGATGRTDARASFSNWGSCLDWFAPGVDITSAWIGSATVTNTISGTSMASPHTAGVAALYLQAHPSAPPGAVRDALLAAATKGVVGDARSANAHLLYSLVAGDGGGGENQPPTASFSVDCDGLTCSFTDLSGDPDGFVAARSWAFGDGGASTSAAPTHTYAVPGDYLVTLDVTDDDGASAGTSRLVTVTEPPPTVISLSAAWSRWWFYYFVTLTWSGASGAEVDVYVNGSFFQRVANSGSFTAYTTTRGTYTWRVCEVGTGVCSSEATTTF